MLVKCDSSFFLFNFCSPCAFWFWVLGLLLLCLISVKVHFDLTQFDTIMIANLYSISINISETLARYQILIPCTWYLRCKLDRSLEDSCCEYHYELLLPNWQCQDLTPDCHLNSVSIWKYTVSLSKRRQSPAESQSAA